MEHKSTSFAWRFCGQRTAFPWCWSFRISNILEAVAITYFLLSWATKGRLLRQWSSYLLVHAPIYRWILQQEIIKLAIALILGLALDTTSPEISLLVQGCMHLATYDVELVESLRSYKTVCLDVKRAYLLSHNWFNLCLDDNKHMAGMNGECGECSCCDGSFAVHKLSWMMQDSYSVKTVVLL